MKISSTFSDPVFFLFFVFSVGSVYYFTSLISGQFIMITLSCTSNSLSCSLILYNNHLFWKRNAEKIYRRRRNDPSHIQPRAHLRFAVFVCGDHRLSVVKEKLFFFFLAASHEKQQNRKKKIYIYIYTYIRESALFRPFITHHHHHHLVLIAAPKKSDENDSRKESRGYASTGDFLLITTFKIIRGQQQQQQKWCCCKSIHFFVLFFFFNFMSVVYWYGRRLQTHTHTQTKRHTF